MFSLLVFEQIFQTLAARSWLDPAFPGRTRSNWIMIGSLAFSLVCTFAIIYWPLLQDVFGTKALSGGELLASVILSTFVFWSIELEKLFKRKRR